jgi:hypothetical protein
VFAGLAIWALAHWNAAPGRSVSVLWGLVEYTKQNPQAVGRQESIPTTTVSLRKGSVPTPKVSSLKESDQITSLEGNRQGRVEVIAHSYSQASWSAGRAELRKLRGLRELSALESGKPLDSMPGGTFGFVDFMMEMMGRSKLSSALPKITVRRFDSKDYSDPIFEIHCDRQADRILLGFTTETTASALTSSSGIKEVVLAARPRVDLTSLVLIDVRLLRSMGLRLIESGTGKTDWVMDIML